LTTQSRSGGNYDDEESTTGATGAGRKKQKQSHAAASSSSAAANGTGDAADESGAPDASVSPALVPASNRDAMEVESSSGTAPANSPTTPKHVSLRAGTRAYNKQR